MAHSFETGSVTPAPTKGAKPRDPQPSSRTTTPPKPETQGEDGHSPDSMAEAQLGHSMWEEPPAHGGSKSIPREQKGTDRRHHDDQMPVGQKSRFEKHEGEK